MLIELSVYGLCTGLFNKIVNVKNEVVKNYIVLILSMLIGRLTYGYLNSYLLSDLSNLDIVEFLSTNSKWLNCIVGFRDNDFMSFTKGYTSRDVIIGKIADDDTSLVINAYITGAYGKVGSKEAYDTAVKLLKPEKLKNQICFKTNKAISKLHYIDSEVVKI